MQCQIYVASAKTKGRASSDRMTFPTMRFDFQISIICEHSRAGDGAMQIICAKRTMLALLNRYSSP